MFSPIQSNNPGHGFTRKRSLRIVNWHCKHSAPAGQPLFRTPGPLPHLWRPSRGTPHYLRSYHSRFTIHYLLTAMIGFDRSAFAAGPSLWAGNQNVNRVNVRFINEGLSEHPTKKLSQTSVTPSVVLSTRMNPIKRFFSSASLQLSLQELCIDPFGEHAILLTQLGHYPDFLDR